MGATKTTAPRRALLVCGQVSDSSSADLRRGEVSDSSRVGLRGLLAYTAETATKSSTSSWVAEVLWL